MTVEQEEVFARYQNKGFSEDQLEEIKLGLEAGYDVKVYARKGIPAEEMAYIRKYMTATELFKEPEEVEQVETDKDFERIDKEYKEYKDAIQMTVFEKIVVFAITISGLAIIAAIYTMIMSWPLIR